MANGYMGKILWVDLSKAVWEESVSEVCRKFLWLRRVLICFTRRKPEPPRLTIF